MHEYNGHERRSKTSLSEEQLDAIAERAAAKALEKVYGEVGKAVLKRLAWLIGAAAVAIGLWLTNNGHFPK